MTKMDDAVAWHPTWFSSLERRSRMTRSINSGVGGKNLANMACGKQFLEMLIVGRNPYLAQARSASWSDRIDCRVVRRSWIWGLEYAGNGERCRPFGKESA